MAEEVAVPGMDLRPKVRSPLAPALLPIVTLGIYAFVWYYKINKEMASLGRARGKSDELGDSPGKSLLAITLGALVIVPAIISFVHTFQRIQRTQRLLSPAEPLNGWLGLALYLVFSPAVYGYMQSGLNSAWQAGAGVGLQGQFTGQYAAGYQQPGGYPQQTGYPQQVGYQQGYAQQGGGYQQQGGYQSGGYPAQPQQGGGYQSGGYPAQPQQGGYPSGGYPAQQGQQQGQQYPPAAGAPQYPAPGGAPEYPGGYQGYPPAGS